MAVTTTGLTPRERRILDETIRAGTPEQEAYLYVLELRDAWASVGCDEDESPRVAARASRNAVPTESAPT